MPWGLRAWSGGASCAHGLHSLITWAFCSRALRPLCPSGALTSWLCQQLLIFLGPCALRGGPCHSCGPGPSRTPTPGLTSALPWKRLQTLVCAGPPLDRDASGARPVLMHLYSHHPFRFEEEGNPGCSQPSWKHRPGQLMGAGLLRPCPWGPSVIPEPLPLRKDTGSSAPGGACSLPPTDPS